MRRLTALLLAFVLGFGVAPAWATGTCAVYKTWSTNASLTAADLNNSFVTVAQTNMIPTCLDGASATVAAMQTTADPYPSQAESLATTTQGELQRMRYVMQQTFGLSQWYKYTDPFVVGPAALTGSNKAGSNTTLQGGLSTGTGVGGHLYFGLAYPGTTGSSANAVTTVGTLFAQNNQSSGTQAMVTFAPTINQSGTAGYTALLVNPTETATGSGTNLLLDLQVGGSSKAKVDHLGAATFTSATLTTALSVANGGTGKTSYTTGDLVYASSGTAISGLADVGTGQVLTSGGVGVAPAYSASPTLTGLTLSGATANSFLYSGTSGALTTTSAPTNGQLLVGSTGAAPVAAVITAGAGITVTNGAGSITLAAAGGVNVSGTLRGSGGVDYDTTSASFSDVDATNLKVTVTVPTGAKFIRVWVSVFTGPSSGTGQIQVLAAGTAVPIIDINNGVVSPNAMMITRFAVVANPTAGTQTIALQYKSDGTNHVIIKNPNGADGVSAFRPQMMYEVTS